MDTIRTRDTTSTKQITNKAVGISYGLYCTWNILPLTHSFPGSLFSVSMIQSPTLQIQYDHCENQLRRNIQRPDKTWPPGDDSFSWHVKSRYYFRETWYRSTIGLKTLIQIPGVTINFSLFACEWNLRIYCSLSDAFSIVSFAKNDVFEPGLDPVLFALSTSFYMLISS